MEDYLFVTEETSAFFLGNALALLAPESQDGETLTLEDMAVYYKKEICTGLLDGSLSMEDMWFND